MIYTDTTTLTISDLHWHHYTYNQWFTLTPLHLQSVTNTDTTTLTISDLHWHHYTYNQWFTLTPLHLQSVIYTDTTTLTISDLHWHYYTYNQWFTLTPLHFSWEFDFRFWWDVRNVIKTVGDSWYVYGFCGYLISSTNYRQDKTEMLQWKLMALNTNYRHD